MLKKTAALFFCFILGSIAYSQQITAQISNNDAEIAYFYDGAPSKDRSNYNEDWTNRRAFIGGWGGHGDWYLSPNGNDYYGGVIGFKAELCIAQYFSLDFDVGLEFGVTGWGLVTPCADVLAHIPFRFDFGLDIGILGGIFLGDPFYAGICGGASLGCKIGKGVLFLDAVYLMGMLYDDYDEVYNTGFIVRIGYKIGVGSR
jgi:hypothetical protein